MALTIITPDDLGKVRETYLFEALLAFGAEYITGNEWRFQGVTPREDCVNEIRKHLDESYWGLVDRLEITSFHPRS